MDRLKINGLKIMNRTMFSTADEFWRTDHKGFPERVMLRMRNVPYLLDDDALIEKLDLPPDVKAIKPITREKEKLSEGYFYNGKALMLLNIQNEGNENELREWSFKSACREKHFKWLDIPFNAHPPVLNSCTFCEVENKPHIGHNIAWCRFNKTGNAVKQEPNHRIKSNERNLPRRELRKQSSSSEQRSQSRESNPREQKSPSRESNLREESPHNKFDHS